MTYVSLQQGVTASVVASREMEGLAIIIFVVLLVEQQHTHEEAGFTHRLADWVQGAHEARWVSGVYTLLVEWNHRYRRSYGRDAHTRRRSGFFVVGISATLGPFFLLDVEPPEKIVMYRYTIISNCTISARGFGFFRMLGWFIASKDSCRFKASSLNITKQLFPAIIPFSNSTNNISVMVETWLYRHFACPQWSNCRHSV